VNKVVVELEGLLRHPPQVTAVTAQQALPLGLEVEVAVEEELLPVVAEQVVLVVLLLEEAEEALLMMVPQEVLVVMAVTVSAVSILGKVML